jgi:hypothetical protein
MTLQTPRIDSETKSLPKAKAAFIEPDAPAAHRGFARKR